MTAATDEWPSLAPLPALARAQPSGAVAPPPSAPQSRHRPSMATSPPGDRFAAAQALSATRVAALPVVTKAREAFVGKRPAPLSLSRPHLAPKPQSSPAQRPCGIAIA